MWCYRSNRKCNQEHVSVEVVVEHIVLELWCVAAPIRGWASLVILLCKRGEKTAPRHKSQLHLMIAKGWSTCRLYCSSIVKPSTRRDHLSDQSALREERRRWILAHYPCGYLCLTARKKESKAGYKVWKRHSGTWTSSPWQSKGWPPSFIPDIFSTHMQNLFPVFGWFSSESIPALKSKWARCALHVERWEGA